MKETKKKKKSLQNSFFHLHRPYNQHYNNSIKENKKLEADFLIKYQIFKLSIYFYEQYAKCT